MSGIQEWLSFYFKRPDDGGLASTRSTNLFIQLMKLKNTLRHLKGEELITPPGPGVLRLAQGPGRPQSTAGVRAAAATVRGGVFQGGVAKRPSGRGVSAPPEIKERQTWQAPPGLQVGVRIQGDRDQGPLLHELHRPPLGHAIGPRVSKVQPDGPPRAAKRRERGEPGPRPPGSTSTTCCSSKRGPEAAALVDPLLQGRTRPPASSAGWRPCSSPRAPCLVAARGPRRGRGKACGAPPASRPGRPRGGTPPSCSLSPRGPPFSSSATGASATPAGWRSRSA